MTRFSTATVELTPTMMADTFWAMSSSEQINFFGELAKVIQRDQSNRRKQINKPIIIPIVASDHFEPEDHKTAFGTPCCWCKHRHGSDDQDPCADCGHNGHNQ
jgi:hypothetical protein